jgi:hypothetical protein
MSTSANDPKSIEDIVREEFREFSNKIDRVIEKYFPKAKPSVCNHEYLQLYSESWEGMDPIPYVKHYQCTACGKRMQFKVE